MNAKNCVKEMSREELVKIINAKFDNLTQTSVLDYNKATQYIFSDSTAVILPAHLEFNGLYFLDLSILEDCISSNCFPVSDIKAFLFMEKNKIDQIEKNEFYFLEKFKNLLNNQSLTIDLTKSSIDIINKSLNEFKPQIESIDEYNTLFHLYIATIIKSKLDLKWNKINQLSLIPFNQIQLEDDNFFYCNNYEINYLLAINIKLSIEQFIEEIYLRRRPKKGTGWILK